MLAGAPERLPNNPGGIDVNLAQLLNVLRNILDFGTPDIVPNSPDGIDPVRFVQLPNV